MSSEFTDYEVLVLDTDEQTLVSISEALDDRNIQLKHTAALSDLRESLKKGCVELLFLEEGILGDLYAELIPSIKKSHPLLKIVVITTEPSVRSVSKFMKLGVTDYLIKPLDPAELEMIIEKVFKTQQPPMSPGDKTIVSEKRHDRYIAGYKVVGTSAAIQGGAGTIYKVEEPEVAEPKVYALKILNTNDIPGADAKDYLERFMCEAEVLAQIDHPNVVKVIDYGMSSEEFMPYIVMEYIHGDSLDFYIRDTVQFDYRQKAEIILQLARAVSAIHGVDIVHRDIKPQNVVVDDNQIVKIVDFGIAKVAGSDLTMTDDILGTPCYMSPEALLSANVDSRSDIFSLGILTYEFFLRSHPFNAESFDLLSKIIRNEPPLHPRAIASDFPPQLQTILARMLKKDPDERYQTVAVIVAELEEYLRSTQEDFSKYIESHREGFLSQTKTQIIEQDWKF